MNTIAKPGTAFRKARLLGWFALGLLLFVGLLLLVGGRKSALTVQGIVKVDGEPLANGSISCVPVDDQDVLAEGRGPGGGATIKDGKYLIDQGLTMPGRYEFEIQGTHHVPGRKDLDPIMSYRHIAKEVPVVQVTLIKEVATGSNTIDFDLKGIASKRANAGK
jgi:hypothetical protein